VGRGKCEVEDGNYEADEEGELADVLDAGREGLWEVR
jgi:hypothetical protein